jgi:hypothetical protein
MAKELPYFKFEPSEWLEGQIQICSDAAIVCFTNIMSGYWSKLGCISYAFALHKYCRRDESILKELIDNQIISINDDEICIEFLDNQLVEFKDISEKRSKSAKKRWSDANALQVDSKSNAIREEKKREEKKREENKKFVFKTSLLDYGFKKNLVDDWLRVRAKKKLSDTHTAYNGFIKELEKKECDINTVMETIVANSWGGFKWEWMNGVDVKQGDSLNDW